MYMEKGPVCSAQYIPYLTQHFHGGVGISFNSLKLFHLYVMFCFIGPNHDYKGNVLLDFQPQSKANQKTCKMSEDSVQGHCFKHRMQ